MGETLRRLMIHACTCIEVGAVALGLLTLLAVGALGCSSPRVPERPAVDLRQDADQAAVLAAEAEAAVEVAPPGADGAELRALAAKLRARATALDHLATEHQARAAAEAREAEVARWREICRWIALASIVLGGLVAAIGLWQHLPLVPEGGALLAGVGLLVQTWGESLSYLVWLLPLLGAGLVIAAALLALRRRDRVTVETSHLADALEAGKDALGRTVDQVKASLATAQVRARLKGAIAAARRKVARG